MWTLLEDADIGKVDYLVIETSGVTDPLSIITTLERDYGKMYRIRLDMVVTVVDVDVLLSKISGDSESLLNSVAADSQLKCADVVLLNKRDLVSEEGLEKAKSFIQSSVPGVVVYPCKGSAIPLHYIMEVREVSAGPQLVSHEVTTSAYTVGLESSQTHKERHSSLLAKDKACGASDSSQHLSRDEFVSTTFESKDPFSLSSFQALLGKRFPAGVCRMKGSVWFAENRSTLYSFNMSGRQRYEIVPCASQADSLTGAFAVQLVAIGRNTDIDSVKSALSRCTACAQTSDVVDLVPEEREHSKATLVLEAEKLVCSDERFELLSAASERTATDELSTSSLLVEHKLSSAKFIDFRVTGCCDYGVTEKEAATIYGIDFNKMNSELAKRTNGCSKAVSLLPVLLPSGVQVCRHGLDRDAPFEEAWSEVQTVAVKLIDEFYRAVGYCKCGM